MKEDSHPVVMHAVNITHEEPIIRICLNKCRDSYFIYTMLYAPFYTVNVLCSGKSRELNPT